MGHLRQQRLGIVFPLGHHVLVGRSSSNDLALDDPKVSGQHAVVYWNGELWVAKDLGSRNGTFLNGRRVEQGVREQLRAGDELCFGSTETVFVLEDDSAPPATARRVDTGERLVSEDDVLVLCASEGPQHAAVFSEGAEWWLEHGGDRTPVRDRQRVCVNGHDWELSLPPTGQVDDLTLTDDGSLRLQQIQLEFAVSADEEHVSITVMSPPLRRTLPERTFGYMLLQLARVRLRDGERSELPASEQGWVYADELADGLGMTSARLNVDIFRARRLLERARVSDASDIIERRASTRQLRLGIDAAQVSILRTGGGAS